MPAKILLYLSKQQAIIGVWQRGAVTECHTLGNDENAWAEFAVFLKQHPHNPVYIMLDTVDEDYRTETLPHASGKTRDAMLQRKLSQAFHGNLFVSAQHQGRSKEKRRDDHYLFAALTKTELVQPWLDVLRRQQSPLQGVYLLPTISEWLLPHLGIGQDDMLLVSRHAAGLRQSFFSEGRLKLSRLTSLELEEDGDVTLYADEIEKTRFYLNSLRLLPREQPLTVYLLDYQAHLEPLAKALQQDPALRCILLQEEEVRHKLSLGNTRCAACPIFPHLMALGRHNPQGSLAPAELLRPYRLHQMRQALYMAAGAVLAGSLAVTGIGLWHTHQQRNEQADMQQQTRQLTQQYEQVAKAFPRTPVSADNLLKAVEIIDKLRQTRLTPEAFMQSLSLALNQYPNIQINRLQWRISSRAAPGTAAANQPVTPDDSNPSGDLEAELSPFSGDYRAAQQQIQAFAATLRSLPGVADTSITKLPLNIDPSAALHGTTQDRTETGGASGFTLHITLKAP